MMFTKVVKNLDNLDVSSNEYASRQSLQRIIDKLYQNDVALMEFYDRIFGNFSIGQYDSNIEYRYNQIVWFRCESECDSPRLADSGFGLHVLRCAAPSIKAGSLASYPRQAFDELGWKDLNPSIDILNEFGVRKVIEQYVRKKFSEHSSDTQFHPYGRLSYNEKSRDALPTKILKTDFSNAAFDREQTFFPYQTIYLKQSGALLNGFGRCYDNGLLEFDLTFRVGDVEYRETDLEYGLSSDVLSCNNLSFKNVQSDQKYFNSNADTDIFCPSGADTSYSADFAGQIEYGKNDYCNVYKADIEFAQDSDVKHRFMDSNYMIFASDVMCQDRDFKYGSLNVGANQMVYAKKTQTGFTAVYIVYPNQRNYGTPGYNAANSGLMSNSFHCHIVGRWR